MNILKNKKSRRFLVLVVTIALLFSTVVVTFFRPRTTFADTTLGFNEGYGTSINDGNGNVSAGTITGAVWKTDDLCFDGKCLYFDGSGDYVTFADDSDLDLGASDQVTIEGWFRTKDFTTGTKVIVGKGESVGADGAWGIGLFNGSMLFSIDNDNVSSPSDYVLSTQTYDDNKWHHFAAIKNGTSSISLYVDGNLVGTDSSITSGSLANDDAMLIGYDGDSAFPYDGFVDQIKVYRSLRTQAQIRTDIANQTASRGITAEVGPNQSYISEGLIGYWKMDEASWNNNCSTDTVLDYSGNGLNGDSCPNSTGPTGGAGGRFGNGGDLDGSDDQIDVNSFPYPTGDFTYSIWIRPDTFATSNTIFSAPTASVGGNGLTIDTDTDGDIDVTLNGTLLLNGTNGLITTGTWHHVVVTRSGDTVSSYVNGVLDKTGTDGTALSLEPCPLSIGVDRDSTNCSNLDSWFDGRVDDARVYNRALTSAEISSLYNWAPGPIANWKFNENTGTVANDSSGYGNVSSTFVGNTKFAIGKYGSGVVFDNNDGSVRFVETSSTTDLGAVGTSYTVSVWVKNSDVTSSTDGLIAKHGANSGATPFRLSLTSSAKTPTLVMSDGTTTVSFSGVKNITDGAWHYITAVRNVETDLAYIYVDGVLEATATDTTNPALTLANNDDISIGNSRASYTTDDLNATVDDAVIYNYARTQAQIIDDMNAGSPVADNFVGSAVAYWKFDEGANTTAYDSNSSNGGAEDLTLSSATSAWSNSGKFNKAFNAGGARWLTRADDADLDFTAAEDITISLWLNSSIASAGNPSATEYLINKPPSGASNGGYAIYANTSGQVCFGIDDDNSTFPEDSVCTSSDVYDNTWHHIVAVKTGTRRLDMYLDAKANGTADTSISSTVGSLANTSTIRVGSEDVTDDTDDFNGYLDEIQIFRGALTNSQINSIYNQNSSQTLGALSTDASGNASNSTERSYCPPGDTTATCSPIGEWKLDENTGTSAFDSTTTNNTGTLTGTTSWTTGKVGQSVKFDGSSGYISVPYSASQDPAANLTVSFWFKPTVTIDSSISSNKGLVSKANTNTDANNDWVFFWNSADAGRMRFGTYGDNIQTTNATWTAGVWYHIEVVVTSTNTANIYVNGKLDTYNADSNISTDPINGNQNTVLNIGLAKVASGDLYCSCTIDHFRLYDYARSFSQVAWDYALGMPHAWWRFDEGSGSSANDATGNGNTGTVTIGGGGSQTTTTQAWSNGSVGKYNGSINLDGNDDYVTITESDTDGEMDFNSGDQITVTAWINPSSLPAADEYDTIVGKNNSGNGDGYCAQYQGNGAMEFCTINTGAFDCISSTTTPVVAGSWQFLVFTVTLGTDTSMKMYYNGRLQPNGGNGNNVAPPLSNDPIVIGANNGGTEAVTGKIDDVRIYRYTLSQQQIQTVMNQGAVRFNQ